MNGVCEKCSKPIDPSDDTLMDFGPLKGKYICDKCWDDEPIPGVVIVDGDQFLRDQRLTQDRVIGPQERLRPDTS